MNLAVPRVVAGEERLERQVGGEGVMEELREGAGWIEPVSKDSSARFHVKVGAVAADHGQVQHIQRRRLRMREPGIQGYLDDGFGDLVSHVASIAPWRAGQAHGTARQHLSYVMQKDERTLYVVLAVLCGASGRSSLTKVSMFSLIIAIVSIALLVAVVALSAFYGGSTFSDATAHAEAARLKNEEGQIMAAVETFQATESRWPVDVQELVDLGYLSSVPRGAMQASLTVAPPAFISSAHAQAAAPAWTTPLASQPIFLTGGSIPLDVCRQYNLMSRGDDGVLRSPYAGERAQCFGADGAYQVVVTRSSAASRLAEALPSSNVVNAAVPSATGGGTAWDTPPKTSGQVPTGPTGPTGPTEPTEPTEPEAPAPAQLSIPTDAEVFGDVALGQRRSTAQRTVVNGGGSLATGVAVSVPAGFELVGNTCSGSLAAKASCSFAVEFAPQAAQVYSGSVTVSSLNGGSQSFAVSGRGLGSPKAVLTSAPTVSLADNHSSGTKTTLVTYRNDGTAAMTLGSPVLAAPLSVAGNTCTNVAPGDACSITVALDLATAPGSGGHTVAPIAEGEAPARANINWIIYGVMPRWSVSSLAFGTKNIGTTSTLGVTLYNDGNTVANWAANSAIAGLSQGSPYSFTMSACSAVAPGGNCAVTVTFKPVAVGTFTEVGLTMALKAGGTSTLTLGGKGDAPPASNITFSPNAAVDVVEAGSFDVGVVAGQTVVMTIQNSGGGTLVVESTSTNFDGAFSVKCPEVASLTGGQQCQFGITVPANMPYDSLLGRVDVYVNKKWATYTFLSR